MRNSGWVGSWREAAKRRALGASPRRLEDQGSNINAPPDQLNETPRRKLRQWRAKPPIESRDRSWSSRATSRDGHPAPRDIEIGFVRTRSQSSKPPIEPPQHHVKQAIMRSSPIGNWVRSVIFSKRNERPSPTAIIRAETLQATPRTLRAQPPLASNASKIATPSEKPRRSPRDHPARALPPVQPSQIARSRIVSPAGIRRRTARQRPARVRWEPGPAFGVVSTAWLGLVGFTRRSGRRPCWRRPCGGRSRGG